MEEANAAAVRAILEPQRYMETGCLDLHGLHVAEAEAASRDFVQQQLALRQFSEIEIITGAGHHSSGQVAKIKVTHATAVCYVQCVMHVDARLMWLLSLYSSYTHT
jgi:DNA-nicking Smr family endonuclease